MQRVPRTMKYLYTSGWFRNSLSCPEASLSSSVVTYPGTPPECSSYLRIMHKVQGGDLQGSRDEISDRFSDYEDFLAGSWYCP